MAGYLIGTGVLAFAIWRLWSNRRPEGAIVLHGTILEELSMRSSRPGARTLVYAPRVAYRHPLTGRDEVLEPSAFSNHRFTAGEPAELIYDPATERMFRPLDRPIRDTAVLGLVGVGLIVAQFLDG